MNLYHVKLWHNDGKKSVKLGDGTIEASTPTFAVRMALYHRFTRAHRLDGRPLRSHYPVARQLKKGESLRIHIKRV